MAATALQPLPEDWHRALAIVAHPDDLEYGAASAVARWTAQGKYVAYVLVSSGEAGIDSLAPAQAGPLREEEERRSARAVGVESVAFLGHRDGVIEYGLALRRDLSRAIRQHRPEVLLTLSHQLTWPSGALNMADHRWTTLAVLDAARDAGNRWIFPELLQEGLEVWNGVRFVCLQGSSQPTHAVDVSDFLDQGMASLREHKVYIQNLPEAFDPDAYLRQSAEKVGQQFGCPFAVSFAMVTL